MWAILALCGLAWMAGGPAPALAQSTFQFAIPTFSVYENGTNVGIVVLRTGDTTAPGSVNFATSDGPMGPNGASQPNDYTGTNGVLNFTPGEIVQTFNVFVTDDLAGEFDELLNVTLSNPNGGALGLFSTAQVLIFDDDSCFFFGMSTNTLDEDATNFVITVTRNPVSSGPASVEIGRAHV